MAETNFIPAASSDRGVQSPPRVTMIKLCDRPLDEVLTERERKKLYTCVVGGIAYPGDFPGCVILLAVGRETNYTPWCAFQVAEYLSENIVDLITHACLMDLQWGPDSWVADVENDAAFAICCKVNETFERDKGSSWRGLVAHPPLFIEHKQPYEYMRSFIDDHLRPDRQRLFLKDSQADYYRTHFTPSQSRFLKWGAFPPVEALAFALREAFAVHEDVQYEPHRKTPRRRDPMLC